MRGIVVRAVVAMVAVSALVRAANATAPPPAVAGIAVTEHLGELAPLETRLVDQNGKEVTLGHYFRRGTPVLLIFAYYDCPMLCDLVIDGMAKALTRIRARIGSDFRVVTVSFDPRETAAEARDARKRIAERFSPPLADDVWPFLVGRADDVRGLADSVGFPFRYDKRSGRYAHAVAEILLTPEGRVSRYIYGFDAAPEALDTWLKTAADGGTGRSLQQVLLQCFRYVPSLRSYAGEIAGFLRGGALLILGGVIGLVVVGRRLGRGGPP